MASHHPVKHQETYVQTGQPQTENEKLAEILKPEEYLLLDSFNEDEAEQRFIVSKPTCFLIIGKPGAGKSTIAKKLAQEWKAELVNPMDVILQNIKSHSELGKRAQDILMKGEAVPEALVAKMIDDKINSPEVAHHGYVLEGFPCESDSGFDIAKQMEMIKNWKLQPDFIINLRIADQDLIRRRIFQKIDPISGNIYIKEMYAPNKQLKADKNKSGEEGAEEGEEEEEGEEGEEEKSEEPQDEFFAQVPQDVVERLVLRPEDLMPQVEESIKSFKEALLHVLEDQMASMDQSYLIELDTNLSPTILMKQLLLRFQSYTISKAAKPLRMNEPVETGEEGEEGGGGGEFIDGEIEDILNTMQSKRRLAAKFKWRRSKCSYYCPVSLKDGRITNGKAEFAASFLDKMYMMADENALKEFLKNPRPYLRLPQPRAPCKLSILGPKFSGKTTLCATLAKKYNAKVIDMSLLVEPEQKRYKDELIQKTRAETTQAIVDQIKQKFQEKLDRERIKRDQEAADRAAAAEAQLEGQQQQQENEQGETASGEGESQPQEENQPPPPPPAETTVPLQSEEESNVDKNVYLSEEGDIIVSQDHPEIAVAVEKALEEASKTVIEIQPSDYVRILLNEIEKIRKERAKLDPLAPTDGGWILDNFPNHPDQLNAMVESNLVPDGFIVLQDSTEDSNILVRRWYNANRYQIDEQIIKRLADEEEQKKIDEQKKASENQLIKPDADLNESSNKDLNTTQKSEKKASGETSIIEPNQEGLEKIVEEDETHAANILNKLHGSVGGTVLAASASAMSKLSSSQKSFSTGVEPKTPTLKVLPIKGPETTEFLATVKASMDIIKGIQNTVVTLTGNEPTTIEINNKKATDISNAVKSLDDCCQEAATSMEKIFKFTAVEFEGGEEEEPEEGEEEGEEEDFDEDAGDEEGGEEEDEDEAFDPSLKEKNVSFGDTSYFCPVSLFNKNILIPGNPEIQCKYRERFFRFTSEEARAQFIENPEHFLSTKKIRAPPPLRILFLGPRGSGKSTQARYLADKLNIFHIKFRDYLQEMIIGKCKKIIEPEREEDKTTEDDEAEEEEEEQKEAVAATGLAAKQPAKIEEILPELTEREETIKGYLEKDETLPSEILDEVIVQLWNQEPFKSRGFILDGFPNNESQAQYLIEKGFFPDAFIILRIEEDDVIKRLLPPRLKVWQEKMKIKKDKKKARALKKREKLMEKMKKRREEELAKYEERRREKEEEAAAAGEEPEEEDFDVEALLQEEFADELQEEEEIEDVQEDEIKDNMINDIRTQFENQNNMIETVKDNLQEVFIPRFTITGNRKETIVRFLIQKKLQRFIEFRESLFERVYPVKINVANRLIDFGYKRLSRFGRWCPIKLMDGDPVMPLYDDKHKPYPVIHRSYIYFLSSKKARTKFMQNPLRYLKQPTPLSVVPFKLSIIGPPKSGKTTLANRFVKEYNCVRLSIGEAIRAVLANQPDTELAENINAHLCKGKTVPDELAIQCLEVAIMDVKCQLNGFVLDNYPVTKNQIKLMTDRCIIPVKVIELKCDVKEVMQRCIKDRTNAERLARGLVLNDSPEIMGYKIREWKSEVGFIRDWYNKEHKNLIELDGQESKWSLWEKAKRIGFESIRHVQVYLHKVSSNKAACISKLCVTYDEMCSRLGDFGQYCPVSLALYDELVNCADQSSMDFVAEYQGYYYKMFSEKELNLFLETPEKFVPPQAPRKLPPPNLLPAEQKPEFVTEVWQKKQKPIELMSYCPVTFYDGKLRYEAIEEGDKKFAALYKEKLYLMKNKEALDKFMRKPELYAFLKLPHKLPPLKKPENNINVFNLPITGYLEQTVADLIKRSLNEVGSYKPKFPFISPSRSALLYVAYYLKAYNPKSTEYRRKKYKQKLSYFEQKCELINYLYKETTLKYKDPSKRTEEYNIKLESFFSLQDNAPTMNWLA